MEIIVKAEPKEIAALVLALQERQEKSNVNSIAEQIYSAISASKGRIFDKTE